MENKWNASTIAIIVTVILSVVLLGVLALGSKNKLSATEREIRDVAISIGLDEEKFIEDFRSSETDDRIKADISDAKSRLQPGENLSTPTIYINGDRLDLSDVYTGSTNTDETSIRQQASDLADYLENIIEEEKAKDEPSLPLKVEIFDDLECPYCANFYLVEQLARQILDDAEITFEIKHLPLEDIHPLAKRYAKAVIAAEKQDQKEMMIRKLFEKEHGSRLDFSILDN